jgi:site-specific DNA-methyltransferase (adenine-specific)
MSAPTIDAVIHCGEAYDWLRSLPSASIDAVVTDPPYCSGGLHTSARQKSTAEKYVLRGHHEARPDFDGDARDQRSFTTWAFMWLLQCYRVMRPGGSVVCMIDWRQLPAMTDAIQAAGFTWRSVGVWDKTDAARPRANGFRQQAEFWVWATRGRINADPVHAYLPGLLRTRIESAAKRQHQTQKPVDLMRMLVQIAPPGGMIIDPFAGSGSTGVAAIMERRQFAGCEVSPLFAEIARKRIRDLSAGGAQ